MGTRLSWPRRRLYVNKILYRYLLICFQLYWLSSLSRDKHGLTINVKLTSKLIWRNIINLLYYDPVYNIAWFFNQVYSNPICKQKPQGWGETNQTNHKNRKFTWEKEERKFLSLYSKKYIYIGCSLEKKWKAIDWVLHRRFVIHTYSAKLSGLATTLL